MVVDADPDGGGRVYDPPGGVDVARTWLRIAGGMVVGEDQSGRAHLQRPAHDLARVDRNLADAALRERLVPQQLVARVEEQDPQPLGGQVRHRREQIGDERIGIGENRAGQRLRAKGMKHRLADGGELAHRPVVAEHAALGGGAGGERGGERAELVDQPVGPALRFVAKGAEELDQDASAPSRASRRRWLKVPITMIARIG